MGWVGRHVNERDEGFVGKSCVVEFERVGKIGDVVQCSKE
jgi:hypothetical protein